jgi:hypothetical protein
VRYKPDSARDWHKPIHQYRASQTVSTDTDQSVQGHNTSTIRNTVIWYSLPGKQTPGEGLEHISLLIESVEELQGEYAAVQLTELDTAAFLAGLI